MPDVVVDVQVILDPGRFKRLREALHLLGRRTGVVPPERAVHLVREGGEHIRILDQASVPLNLGTLGFSDDSLPAFREMVTAPHGMVLVTGPTGSGKTTTLYGALQEIRTSERNRWLDGT